MAEPGGNRFFLSLLSLFAATPIILFRLIVALASIAPFVFAILKSASY